MASDSGQRDHLEIDFLKSVGLGEFPEECWGPGASAEPEVPPGLDFPPAPAAAASPSSCVGASAGARGEAVMARGLLHLDPWKVNEHCTLEAHAPEGDSVLFCSSCWHHAVCQMRGLVGPCKGPRKLTGGSAYTARLRLQRGEHPSRPGVVFLR